jgi:hypothetical protein
MLCQLLAPRHLNCPIDMATFAIYGEHQLVDGICGSHTVIRNVYNESCTADDRVLAQEECRRNITVCMFLTLIVAAVPL